MDKACKYGCIGSRIILGLIFFVFGLNGFANFMPMPPLPEPAMRFFMFMADSVYLFPLVKGVEVVCGALLLSGLYVPLAIVLIGPNVVNILLFHIFVAGGPGMAIAITAMWLFLIYCYRANFRGVFAMKAKPSDC